VHGLYLLALLKLVTPPLLPVAIPLPAQAPPATPPVVEERSAPAASPGPAPPLELAPESWLPVRELPPMPAAAPAVGAEPAPAPRPLPWRELLLGAWAVGALISFALAAQRVRFVERLVRLSSRAPRGLQREARALARKLGLARCPELRVAPARLAPMLWAPGRRAWVVLPEELLARLDRPARRALVAHELAHYRRNDHRVRWVELVALGLYWWNPLARLAARGLRAAEEACCDAWVVWALPGASRAYAGALVDTAEYLGGAGTPLPLSAGASSPARALERRLTMILNAGTRPSHTRRSLTRRGRLALATLGCAALPFLPALAQDEPAPDDAKARVAELQAKIEANRQMQADLKRRMQELKDELSSGSYRPAHTRYTALQKEYDELAAKARQLDESGIMTLDEVFARKKAERAAQEKKRELERRALKMGAKALMEQGHAEEAKALLELAERRAASAGSLYGDSVRSYYTTLQPADRRPAPEGGANLLPEAGGIVVPPGRRVDLYDDGTVRTGRAEGLYGRQVEADRPAPTERDAKRQQLEEDMARFLRDHAPEPDRESDRIDRLEKRLEELTRTVEKLARGLDARGDGSSDR
jgi:beta-lactamase regulating signal transducer with metallopeptidase domain